MNDTDDGGTALAVVTDAQLCAALALVVLWWVVMLMRTCGG